MQGRNARIPDELHQNWPNPFNPTSTIQYYLAQSGTVKLAVYDLVGRERAVLQSGYIEAGLHSVVFDASQLASGTYYSNLRTESGTLQRSLNILK